MPALDTFLQNKTLMFSAGAVAFLVAALLILFIFRLAFGRRLHMPGGGRTRQPRLGVVDAFDLDRQRQLVLVRRDNVEHLVMIGGPNDVLIESQIVRAEAREMPRSRDKEPTVAPVAWAPGQAPASVSPPLASPPLVSPAPPANLPPASPPPAIPAEPKLVPEEPAVAAREQVPPPAPAPIVSPAPAPSSTSAPAVGPTAPARPPFLPLPPRRPIPPPPSFGARAAGAPPVGPAAEGGAGPAQGPAVPVGPAAPRPTTAPPPSFLRPRPATTPAAAPAPAASPPPVASPTEATVVIPAGAIPAGAPPVAPPQPAKTDKTPSQIDALESLEEEMAKLLGRTMKES